MLKVKRDLIIRDLYRMYKKQKDFFGFNKAINWNKLKDPKVLKELEKIFEEKKLTSERVSERNKNEFVQDV